MTAKPVLHPLRSVLIFPANVQHFVDKAAGSGADALCLDLEDSVAPGEKAAAREGAAAAVRSLGGGRSALLARVNSAASGWLEDDLIAVVQPGLAGIVLSKTEAPADVLRADHYLELLERQRGLERGTVGIIALVETAAGVTRCPAICASSDRLAGALFGAEDFAADMGVQRTAGGQEVLWARTQVAVACRSADVTAVDTPTTVFDDPAAMEQDVLLARSLGYRGKLCIHPSQIAVAKRVFSPAPAEVQQARDLVEAFERDGIARRRAAIAFGGRMVDTPMYVRARRLLELAELDERNRA